MRQIKMMVAVIATAALMLSSIGYAKILGQAGSLEQGTPYFLGDSGLASYYKEGKTGSVSFYCELSGSDGAKALLYGGKNLAGNLSRVLSPGYNGPYHWNFYNLGNKGGNVKVRTIKGKNMTVMCKEYN